MMIAFETLQRALANWPRRMAAAITEFTAKYMFSIAGVLPREEATGIIKHPRLRQREQAFRVLSGRERAVVNSLGDDATDQKPWLVLRAHAARWHGDPFAPAVNPDDVEAWK